MSRTTTETERARPQDKALTSQYRPIGPAAIVAALLCANRKVEDAEEVKQAA